MLLQKLSIHILSKKSQMAKYDKNNDGQISFNEFVKFITDILDEDDMIKSE